MKLKANVYIAGSTLRSERNGDIYIYIYAIPKLDGTDKMGVDCVCVCVCVCVRNCVCMHMCVC